MMPEAPQHETVRRVLFSALEALKPYLADLVVVGGWVPQIYAWTENSAEIAIHSFDVDTAVAGSVPVRGGKRIAELLEGIGFKQQTSEFNFVLVEGRKKRSAAISKFYYRKGRLEVPVEIIAPLKGSGEKIGMGVQAELVVPALRFTDILLKSTQKVAVAGETLAGKRRRLTFHVPTLAAYVFAKGLIFSRRRNLDKRGKDLAYIFEVLKKPAWRKRVVDGLPVVVKKHPDNWFRTFRKNLDDAFRTQGSKGPAWVALQYPNLPPDEVRKEAFETFRAFLDE